MKFMLLLFLCINACAGDDISATDYLGCGFDALTGQYGLGCIFKTTYADGGKWHGPSGVTYDVPDDMFVHKFGESNEIINENWYSSYTKFLSSRTSYYYFSAGIEKGAFALSFKYDKESYFVHQHIDDQSMLQAHSNHVIYYYIASLYPPELLDFNSKFQTFIDRMIDDPQYMFDGIRSFGTHFIYKGLFGARAAMDVFFKKALINDYSADWVSEQVGFTFHYHLFNLSAGGFANRSDITISDIFELNSLTNITFIGGDPEYQYNTTLSLWIKSIEGNAAPLNSTIVPIYPYIQNITKRALFKKYVDLYLSNSYIKRANITNKESVINTEINKVKKNNNEVNKFATKLGCGFQVVNETYLESEVIKLTYNQGKTWVNPINGDVIDIPDQAYIDVSPETLLLNYTYTATEDVEYTETFDQKYKSHYGFLGMGTRTKEVYKYFDMKYKYMRSKSSMVIYTSLFAMTLPMLPLPKLGSMFTRSLELLPIYNETNKQYYIDFFLSYGYAYPDQIMYGGYMTVDLYFDRSTLDVISIERIKEDSSWSFLGLFGSGHGSSSEDDRVDNIFKQGLIAEYTILGGNDLMQPNQYLDWVKTIPGNLMAVETRLVPIWELVRFYDKEKATYLELAANILLNEAQDEFDNYVNSLRSLY